MNGNGDEMSKINLTAYQDDGDFGKKFIAEQREWIAEFEANPDDDQHNCDASDFSGLLGEALDEIERLQSQLADAQARLAGYEVGYDPKVKLPADNELVVADSRTFGWRLVVYSHELFYEGIGGVGFGVRECARWFPLTGSIGGAE